MKSPIQILIAGAACTALAGCGGLLENEKSASASQGASASKPAEQRKAGQDRAGAEQAPATAASEQLIRRVQEQLQAKGVNAGPVDGIWGPETHEGLQQFQKQQGLEPSGRLNAPTLSALGISEQEARGMNEERKTGQQRQAKGQESASQGASAAQGASMQDPPKFENLDANNNGEVSLAESAADTRISRDFGKADKDDSGSLDKQEFEAALRNANEPASAAGSGSGQKSR